MDRASVRRSVPLGLLCFVGILSRNFFLLELLHMAFLDQGLDYVFEMDAILGNMVMTHVESTILILVDPWLEGGGFGEPCTTFQKLGVLAFEEDSLMGSGK